MRDRSGRDLVSGVRFRASGRDRGAAVEHPDVVRRMLEGGETGARRKHPAPKDIDRIVVRGASAFTDHEICSAFGNVLGRRFPAAVDPDREGANLGLRADRRLDRVGARRPLFQNPQDRHRLVGGGGTQSEKGSGKSCTERAKTART